MWQSGKGNFRLSAIPWTKVSQATYIFCSICCQCVEIRAFKFVLDYISCLLVLILLVLLFLFLKNRLSEPSQSLLGSFEESVLNGRIEPVSSVEGFTAEVDVGSSHNFKLPVTVFFYTFCDNDRVSSPYSVSDHLKCHFYLF